MEKQTITYISVDRLNPHPDNPRKDLGDLTELAESIKTNGIMQNLTVIPGHYISLDEFIKMSKAEGVPKDVAKGMYFVGDDYTVIIGHRRLAAAQLAGLTELPCVITEMDERTQITTMLAENMQRADLTVYEQAQGFQMMIDLGATVEEVAEKSGFSQSTVRKRLKIAALDKKVLQKVSSRQLSLMDFDRLDELEDIKLRNSVLKDIGTAEFNQSLASAKRKEKIKKNLPKVKEWLKAHDAKKLDAREAYGSMYTHSIGGCYCGFYLIEEFGEKNARRLPTKKEINGEQLFYTIDDTHYALLVRSQSGNGSNGKKTEAEKERDRIMREVRAKVRELSALHFGLRREFIENITVTKQNREKILAGALLSALYFAHTNGNNKSETIDAILSLDKYEYHTDTIVGAIEAVQDKDLAKVIYSIYNDNAENWFASQMETSCTIPSFNSKQCNTLLQLLYKWLISIGYEPSSDEKAMMDGTHEVLHRGDKK